MFPGIYEFNWDAPHIIFLGVFYLVLVIVFSTLFISLFRSIRDLRQGRVDAIRWHTDFEDLPAAARKCRHEIVGDVASRVCVNAFRCDRCADHARLEAEHPSRPGALEPAVAGFALPADRLYHRGHT
ncbi:MAG: hypothetical protein WBX15_00750, partial [Thermoanaerobaculia bacterium]